MFVLLFINYDLNFKMLVPTVYIKLYKLFEIQCISSGLFS